MLTVICNENLCMQMYIISNKKTSDGGEKTNVRRFWVGTARAWRSRGLCGPPLPFNIQSLREDVYRQLHSDAVSVSLSGSKQAQLY